MPETPPTGGLQDDPTLAGMIRQSDASSAEVDRLSKQLLKLRTESEQYQTRLNLTPVREQQLSEILRDYDLFKQDYTNLLNKKLQSQLTASMEREPGRPALSIGGLSYFTLETVRPQAAEGLSWWVGWRNTPARFGACVPDRHSR